MTKEETVIELIKASQKYGLNADLVCSIASIESNCNHLAIRYEPKFRWVLNVPKMASRNNISIDTEQTMQQMSFGPLQIMGGVLREMFYQDELTKMIYDPALVIDFSCKRLKMLFDKYGNIIDDVLACWNGGNRKKYLINGLLQYSNQSYVDKVLLVYNNVIGSKIPLGDK